MQQRLMLHLITFLGLASALIVHASVNDLNGHAETEPAADIRRRQLQERNRDAIVRLRSLLSEHLSQSPATMTPYPPRPATRRRRRLSPARPAYATQCIYEPPQPYTNAEEDLATKLVLAQSDDVGDEGQRRRHLTQQAGLDPTAAPPPPPPGSGRCYLNPMVLARPDFPDPENPIEIMLLKSAWTAYQCSFEKRKERCGTYRHPPYDCRWQEDRCVVTSDYLLPRLLAYLHCRDDAVLTPFWDRCYTVGVLTGDSDWCGQPDGNWARCWWFPARNDSEVDLCAPSPQGGVESREAYDELVARMREGIWERDWFGSCATADLVYTIKSACAHTNLEDCQKDEVCTARRDLPVEYGMCRLRDDIIWRELFHSGSALFNAMAAAQAECAEASTSRETCLQIGGAVTLDPDKFSDVIDLVFIEEVTPGAAAALRAAPWVVLLAAAAAAALLDRMWR